MVQGRLISLNSEKQYAIVLSPEELAAQTGSTQPPSQRMKLLDTSQAAP